MSDAKVGLVFDALCDSMIKALSVDKVDPAVYKEVIQFLKNLNVSAEPVPGSKAGKVINSMPQDIPFPRAVKAL